MTSNNNRKNLCIALWVVGMFFMLGASPANAALSKVGPALSNTPSVAQGQIESLIQHHQGVTTFVARQTYLSASVIAQAEVVSVKKTTCVVGASKQCGYNTGADGSGNLHTTSFRKGTRVAAYVATIEYDKGKTVKVTFLKPCSNVLGIVKQGHTKQPVSDKKPITIKIVASANAQCAGGSASASVTVKTQIKSWSSFNKAIASASAACVPASAGTGSVALTCAQMGLVQVGVSCQANSASSSQDSASDATVDNDCKGPNTNSSQCNTTIIQTTTQITNITQITINNVCGKVVTEFSDGTKTVEIKDNDGNIVNEEYCTTKVENPPTTPTCPPNTTGTYPNCYPPCPAGSTRNPTTHECVKNGTTTPTPTTTTPGTTPAPADTVSAKCYWESAGTYKNVPHASGEAVRQDQLGANGACPVGSFGV